MCVPFYLLTCAKNKQKKLQELFCSYTAKFTVFWREQGMEERTASRLPTLSDLYEEAEDISLGSLPCTDAADHTSRCPPRIHLQESANATYQQTSAKLLANKGF